MVKSKQDYLNDLVLVAFEMDDMCAEIEARTKRLSKMASLAREGKKDTQEYKDLEWEAQQPTAFDFGDEMADLRKIVKRLRKYSFS